MTVMEPTADYLAAPEISRTRAEARHGDLRVVVENYSDSEHVFGRSMVYVSTDDGQSFVPVGWDVAWSSQLRKLGQDWPPHDLRIESLDAEDLRVTYIEASYDGPVDRQARYSFAQKRWSL